MSPCYSTFYRARGGSLTLFAMDVNDTRPLFICMSNLSIKQRVCA